MPHDTDGMVYQIILRDRDGSVLNNWKLTLFADTPGTLNMLRESDRVKLLDGICEEIVALERTEA
jgi:hypothetical protein